jgi:hypothetical protein
MRDFIYGRGDLHPEGRPIDGDTAGRDSGEAFTTANAKKVDFEQGELHKELGSRKEIEDVHEAKDPDIYAKDPDIYDDPPVGVFSEEVKEFLTETGKNVVTGVVQLLADLHGAGGPLRLARYALKAVEWLQTAEGERGADVGMPLYTGSDVELDLSVHLGADSGPPVTLCCALSGDSPVGVLVVHGVEVDPGNRSHEARQEAQRTVSVSPGAASAETILINRPQPKLRRGQPRTMSDVLERYANKEQLPEMLRRNLHEKSANLVVWHSTAKEAVALIYLNSDTRPSWRLVTQEESAGRVRFHASLL